jgi:hypothetical protein
MQKVKKNIIPHNKRLIGNKWVFKKKKDGRYRARLCALGYSQKPGEDFIDVSSPVVDDVTVRTVITNMLARGWENEVMDIATAFLYADMEEEVYMKLPKGIDMIENGGNSDEDCVMLLRTIYGTKQAVLITIPTTINHVNSFGKFHIYFLFHIAIKECRRYVHDFVFPTSGEHIGDDSPYCHIIYHWTGNVKGF